MEDFCLSPSAEAPGCYVLGSPALLPLALLLWHPMGTAQAPSCQQGFLCILDLSAPVMALSLVPEAPVSLSDLVVRAPPLPTVPGHFTPHVFS